MRIAQLLITVTLLLSACSNEPADPLPTTQASSTTKPAALEADTQNTLYHPNPEHLWNQLYRQFYMRTASDGTLYGYDSLEPLLWGETIYLLQEPSHSQAIALLDQFLAEDAHELIEDPVKRAMLQRDLWAVFDWAASRFDDGRDDEQQALQERLAVAIQRLALPREVIEGLPDNYQAAVGSNAFPTTFQEQVPDTPFLPPDLFASANWVNVGRENGPMALSHIENRPFLGRSTFLVFYHFPGTDDATTAYVQALRDAENLPGTPPFDGHMEVALVRRMMLIDDQSDVVLSPLVETVQLRHAPAQSSGQFYKFDLSRQRLFAGHLGGLRAVSPEERTFPFFMSHEVDPFEQNFAQKSLFPPLQGCQNCHEGGMAQSIISYSRHRFDYNYLGEPLLVVPVLLKETTAAREAQLTIAWKMAHDTWQQLQAYWTESHSP